MQLAFEARPLVETHFSKDELHNYMRLFNEAATPRDGELGVTQTQMLPLLRSCCDSTKDKATRKKLNRGLVRKICEAYDADKSGRIEWEEFLHVAHDLKSNALVDTLYET